MKLLSRLLAGAILTDPEGRGKQISIYIQSRSLEIYPFREISKENLE
jgi:hypothetical protein